MKPFITPCLRLLSASSLPLPGEIENTDLSYFQSVQTQDALRRHAWCKGMLVVPARKIKSEQIIMTKAITDSSNYPAQQTYQHAE